MRRRSIIELNWPPAVDWQELSELRQRVSDLTQPARSPTAAELLFTGLAEQLPKAAAEGRMDAWQKCADSISALLVSVEARNAAVEAIECGVGAESGPGQQASDAEAPTNFTVHTGEIGA